MLCCEICQSNIGLFLLDLEDLVLLFPLLIGGVMNSCCLLYAEELNSLSQIPRAPVNCRECSRSLTYEVVTISHEILNEQEVVLGVCRHSEAICFLRYCDPC
jgi:hypothetical protein